MLVLNVTRWATNVEKLVFTDATRLAVSAYKRRTGHADELMESLWDVATAARIEFALSGFAAGRLGQFRSGEWFLGSTEDRRGLIAHHPATGRTVVEPVPGLVGSLALTPDGETVLFSWLNGSDTPNGYGSRTWSDGAFGPGFRVAFEEHGDGHCVIPLSDGERFVTLGRYVINPHMTVRSVATGEKLSKGGMAVFDQPALAVSPDAQTLVAAVQLTLYVLPTADLRGAGRREVRKDGRKHFTGIAFHPSGRFLAATSNDETVMLYDTTTWEVTRTFTWEIGRMRSIAFSPDGTLAAAGGDKGKVVVWDVDV